MLSPVYLRRPYRSFYNELDHVIAGLFGPSYDRARPLRNNGAAAKFPALNVFETDDAYLIEAELPGVSRDDLEISVVDNELTVKGERKEQRPEKSAAIKREASYGTFARTLKFRTDLDANSVEATFKNGVLSLKLPKAPHSRPRKIAINTH